MASSCLADHETGMWLRLLLLGVTTQASEYELCELADVLTSTLGGLMIQPITVRSVATVRQAGQVNIAGLGALGDLWQSLSEFPRFVSGFTHAHSLPQSIGRGQGYRRLPGERRVAVI
jgi:hypothetical protein